MNQSSDKVLRYIAGNENIEDISINDLRKLADDNPYFSVAQFYLAKKLKEEKDNAFLKQAQKTAIYFSNPHWLHYLLNNETQQDFLSDSPDEHIAEIKNSELVNSEDKQVQDAVVDKKEQDDIVYENPVNTHSDLAADNFRNVSQPEEEMPAVPHDTGAATEEFLDEANEDTFVRDNIEQVITETQNPAGIEEAIEVLEEMAGVTHDTDQTTEAFLNEVDSAAEKISQDHLQTAIPPITSDSRHENHSENIEPDEHERMFQNIKAMLDATSEEAEADTGNAVIPIDPYYTIDYFASQGIKLELEHNPKDQLGKHLKKFTDWLKHMKKLGPEDATEVITRTDTEADIQKIAESSNTVREVVTEAMAAVLEKQGKNEKAIELYKKLSFLNPHKSGYFADKIKNLKGI